MKEIKLSNCCDALVKIEGGIPDFGGKYKRGQTFHYECSKCGNACDIKEKPESWEERFDKSVAGWFEYRLAKNQGIEWCGLKTKEVKSFIRNLLISEKSKWMEDLKYGKTCLNCGGKKEGELTDMCNKCLEDA